MGIPGFFGAWLSKDVPSAVIRNNLVPKDVASLALDLNGEIYAAIDSVYGANAERLADVADAELERLFLSNLSSLIMENVTKFQPQYCLIIAVDGVVPAAKLQQQKQRRALITATPTKINSHHITPGTEIMHKIHNSLESFIKLYRAQLPPKVIYSSYLVPGEAEHKIMDLYREGAVFDEFKSKKDHHILCGLDADLIILSLVCPVENIIIFRDRRSDMVNVEELKKFLSSFNPSRSEGGSSDGSSAFDDFCIMMLLIGNDFLPHIPSLENIADGINFMLEVYKQSTGNFALAGKINWANFHSFIELLAAKEASSLIEQYSHSKNKSQLITDNIINNKFNFLKYRDSWYNRALLSQGDPILQERILRIINRGTDSAEGEGSDSAEGERIDNLKDFNEDKVNEMVHSYLLSFSWVFLYYKQGMSAVNHDLLYPYYYTPLLRDISNSTKQLTNKSNYFGYKSHPAMIEFTTLHQLIAVLPRSAIDLLPEELKVLFGLDSPLLDMYLQEFKTDADGKLNDHSKVIIIPFIDKNRIYEAVEQINFERERAELWKPLENEVNISSSIVKPGVTIRPKIIVGDPENYAFHTSGSGSRGGSYRGSERGRGRGESSGRGRGESSGRGGQGMSARGRGGSPNRGESSGRGRGESLSRGRGISNLVKPGVKREPLPEIDF